VFSRFVIIRPIQSARPRSDEHCFCSVRGRRIVSNDPDICLITRERWGPAFGGGLTGSGTITTLIDEFVRGELWTLVEPLLPRVGTRCSPSRTYAEQVHRLKRTQLVNK
jgi:hypothetical protein